MSSIKENGDWYEDVRTWNLKNWSDSKVKDVLMRYSNQKWQFKVESEGMDGLGTYFALWAGGIFIALTLVAFLINAIVPSIIIWWVYSVLAVLPFIYVMGFIIGAIASYITDYKFSKIRYDILHAEAKKRELI